MPATRSWARRKSSLGLVSVPPAKAGIYGVQPPEPNRLTFCPNVTPTTFKTKADAEDMYDDSADDSSATLFPPSSTPAPPPRRRRAPPGKRRSLGYIPRPPNAFMLFRADFVKQKHVPNSIETNHSSLSKIIGSCWRSLPTEEKAIWEKRARVEKAEHKRKYPEYRFRPVHNKNKTKAADAPSANKKMKIGSLPPSLAPIEAMRTEREGFIAQCLLDGLKGEALKQKVGQWDDAHGWEEGAEGMAALEARAMTPNVLSNADVFPAHSTVPMSKYPPRRPSSVPLPNDFLPFHNGYQQPQQYFSQYSDTPFSHAAESSHGLSLDLAGYSGTHVVQSSFNTLPPLNSLRPPSPSPTNFDVGSISRQQRMVLGGRRASSAQDFVNYGRLEDSWAAPHTTWPDIQGQWVGGNWQTGYGEGTGTSPSSSASSLPLQTDTDELPEADTSLFQPGFAFGTSSFSTQAPQSPPPPSPYDQQHQQQCNPFEGYSMEQSNDFQLVQQFLQEQQTQFHNHHNLALAPLDTQSYSPLDTSPLSSSSVQSYSPAYSGSPTPSEKGQELPLHAPQPMHPTSVEDVGLSYHEHGHSPARQPMDDVQMQYNEAHELLDSSSLSAPIDSAAAFNDLWKGLSSSGSFAAAMGFSLDSTIQQADEYVYQQPSPVLESAGFSSTDGSEHGVFSGHVQEQSHELQHIMQAQQDQLTMC
ncbi:hypothetical protein J3R30DRAFT_1092755 [Lentinula aciculospora]|uniref:HMG box domain-containing protein n=1 Tax=Lentinula aciculospora TaxID=153920 RepID=A0A9W9A0Q9_9AGAR|nr:hypothetical protein J3R30DRAFT_1092755 [Lentinula aciculospora]